MKRKYLWLIGGVSVLLVVVAAYLLFPVTGAEIANDKVYVAAEDAGRIDVISPKSQSVIAKIELANKENADGAMYMAHNVQVAPDGKSVWVTANAMANHTASLKTRVLNKLFPTAYAGEGHNDVSTSSDQVVVIDPLTDKITKRIDIGSDLHLAHVVLTPDSRFALATSQNKAEVYKIDTKTFTVVATASAKANAGPHGLRVSPDGKYAYVALMGDKSIGKLSLSTFTFEYIPLNGTPVQTGVTANGKYALASVFTSKSVAIVDTSSGKVRYAPLPNESKGPLQLYPSTDSRYAYVADQGNDFGQPAGNNLYKVDLEQAKTTQTIPVGSAPHGVVVSPDDRFTYVTNMESNDVSVVDNNAGKEVARISVGKKPNGISYWAKP
jgi:YVTN family beta-propeller protein